MAAPTQELFCRFGRRDAGRHPRPEPLPVLRDAPLLVPRHDGGDGRPGAGDGPDQPADRRPAQNRAPEPEQLAGPGQRPRDARPGRRRLASAGRRLQRLGDGEEADQHRHQPEPVHEHVRAQREPRRPREHVQPYDEENESQQRADDPLQRIASHEIRDDGKAEHAEPEVLRRPEGDRRPRERPERQHEKNRPQDPPLMEEKREIPSARPASPRRVMA